MFIISCGVPHWLKNDLTLCYYGKNTGIESLININGYYHYSKTYVEKRRNTTAGEWRWEKDSTTYDLIFFSDGSLIVCFGDPDRDRNNIPLYFQELVEKEKLNNKRYSLNATFNGKYQIFGDTIKAQYINRPGLTNTWYGFETMYKIIDRNKLKIIYKKHLTRDKNDRIDILSLTKYDYIRFCPVSVIPNAKVWLTNRRWFWCK
jgi:hypothetical protein